MASKKASSTAQSLYRLARLHGVQTSYIDALGEHHNVKVETLMAILHSLQMDINKPEEATAMLRQHRFDQWHFHIEPAAVIWDGNADSVSFRVPADATGRLTLNLELEDGSTSSWQENLEELQVEGSEEIEGQSFVSRSIRLPALPLGYHDLTLQVTGRDFSSFLISAPTRAYEPEGRFRGVFAPLYALHSESSWGAGDVSDLRRFAGWAAKNEADFVATLPLLPAYFDDPSVTPSPYSPVSRLFWNEFYLDVPEAARRLGNKKVLGWLDDDSTRREIARLRASPSVDYQNAYALKRTAIEMLAGDVLPDTQQPLVDEYARFRAVRERQQKPWREWAPRLRHGETLPADYDEDVLSFYAAGQRLIGDQLEALKPELLANGQQFYLDLPIGCNADGFDTWKYQDLFAHDIQCGAPPDLLFSLGQAWGLPPMIPQRMRESKYEYLRAVIRHHLSLADILRYDHVIGLHRLYWVPDGFTAREGIFVQYPAEELYAILSLESHRSQSVIVGENLGTVPQHINRAMSKHGIYETYVMQYELPPDESRGIRLPPKRSFAGLNTHDMPPFAGFLEGKDLKDHERLGVRDKESLESGLKERAQRVEGLHRELEKAGFLAPGDRDRSHLLEASLKLLLSGAAKYVVTNVEDLWLEVEAQNIPGTSDGNWQRRLSNPIEALPELP